MSTFTTHFLHPLPPNEACPTHASRTNTGRIQWTPAMDAMLGTDLDKNIGQILGLSTAAVLRRRQALGIVSVKEARGRATHAVRAEEQANAQACSDAGIEPLLAIKRESHHLALMERFAPDTPEPQTKDVLVRMAHRLGTQAGRALYKLRKQTVEPVFGIIKRVMGWRQMSMRGLAKAQGEWNLVTMAWNIKRMHVLRAA